MSTPWGGAMRNVCTFVIRERWLSSSFFSPSRLSQLVSLVNDGLRLEYSSEVDRRAFGDQLKATIANFTDDYIPHMREEEEVSAITIW